jgi:hypothetical protein
VVQRQRGRDALARDGLVEAEQDHEWGVVAPQVAIGMGGQQAHRGRRERKRVRRRQPASGNGGGRRIHRHPEPCGVGQARFFVGREHKRARARPAQASRHGG